LLDESDDEEAPSRKRKRAEKAAMGDTQEEQVSLIQIKGKHLSTHNLLQLLISY
jgi:hypothetical protein